MGLFANLLKTILPALSSEIAGRLLGELKDFARSQVVGLLIPQCARVVTKGIDGLVKAFATHLEPPDANKLKNGVLDEFQRQLYQLAESLRIYADAAYQVVIALRRGDDESDVNSLRNVREKLRKEVEREFYDVFSVLTGGTPED